MRMLSGAGHSGQVCMSLRAPATANALSCPCARSFAGRTRCCLVAPRVWLDHQQQCRRERSHLADRGSLDARAIRWREASLDGVDTGSRSPGQHRKVGCSRSVVASSPCPTHADRSTSAPPSCEFSAPLLSLHVGRSGGARNHTKCVGLRAPAPRNDLLDAFACRHMQINTNDDEDMRGDARQAMRPGVASHLMTRCERRDLSRPAIGGIL